jgi:hypothetical protein
MVINHGTEYAANRGFHSAHPARVATVADHFGNPLIEQKILVVADEASEFGGLYLLQNPSRKDVLTTTRATTAENTIPHRRNE